MVTLQLCRPRELGLDVVLPRTGPGLGIGITGGVDAPDTTGDTGLYIASINFGGAAAADAQLRMHDRITAIDGVSTAGMKHDAAVALLRGDDAAQPAKITVARQEELSPAHEPGSLLSPRRGDGSVLSSGSVAELLHDVHIVRIPGQGLGFHMAGGSDAPFYPGDPNFYITGVVPAGAADVAGLRCGDRILEANAHRVVNCTHHECVERIKSSTDGNLRLLVSRHRGTVVPGVEALFDIDLSGPPSALGITIAGGTDAPIVPGDPAIYVTDLVPAGAAALDGRLQFGDRLVAVNSTSVQHNSLAQVGALMHSGPAGGVVLRVVSAGPDAPACSPPAG